MSKQIKIFLGALILALIILVVSFILLYQQESPVAHTNQSLNYNVNLDPEKLQEYQEKIALIEKSIEAEPDNFQHWIDKGFFQKSLGDLEGAAASYQKAVELSPGNSLPIANLADVYFFMRDYEKAEEYFIKAIEESPQPYLFRNLAELYVYHLSEKKEKAEKFFQEKMQLMQSEPDFFATLTFFYEAFAEPEKALQYYEKLKEIDPERPGLDEVLGELRQKLER